ncbi:MAG TPA: aminotransferase class I/II-fold pyridoxal phosphate-dependent enzyme, partial [Methylomirabilota bacterium]|nr:aminotransferase class I/II-fold pyridoxal phosphate-dependent enzyme [Methylomirabilota bacterium]
MNKNIIKQFIRSDIAAMGPYVPGISAWNLASTYNQNLTQLIKLNANENPYGPSPLAKKAIRNTIFNYYPASDYDALRRALAEYTNTKKTNIIVGAGSDEIIDLILRAVLNTDDKVIDCPPTFDMYRVATLLNRGQIVSVPRMNNFIINVKAMLAQCVDEKIKIIFLCNPN